MSSQERLGGQLAHLAVITFPGGHLKVTEGGGDCHGVRGVDREPGREQTVLQAVADAVVEARGASPVTGARQDPQPRIRHRVQALVP